MAYKLPQFHPSQSPGKEIPPLAAMQPTPQPPSESSHTNLKSPVFIPRLSPHCAGTLAAVSARAGAACASWQLLPSSGLLRAPRLPRQWFLSTCTHGNASTLLMQTHRPRGAHFVHFSQQHIANTLISNANSVQILFRICCYSEKSMPPKISLRICQVQLFYLHAALHPPFHMCELTTSWPLSLY